MPVFKDLTGKRFGRAVAVSVAGKNKQGGTMWNFICDCGKAFIARGADTACGKQQSCGCLGKERRTAGTVRVSTTHGHAKGGKVSSTYCSWQSMLNRAENHDGKHSTYAMVTVCDRWNPSKGGSFENFLADKGERPEGTTFGRFGDIGPYTDANTEWMTKRQQRTEASKKGTRLKLSEAKAKEIRQQYASGVLDQYDLADAFDVSQGQISHIINHKVWKDVGEVKDACLST